MNGGSDPVPREAEASLRLYLSLLREANATQNLVSSASLADGWKRHIVDCAQLAVLVRGDIVDVGSGAGLPGVVLAVLGHAVTMVEPRKKRFDFLCDVTRSLAFPNAEVLQTPVERLQLTFESITARALAPLYRVFELTHHLAVPGTRWVLPKGRSVHEELEVARVSWHGRFELVPSITDPAGMIVVAEDVRPRSRR